MSLNMKLITCIREAQNSVEKAEKEFMQVSSRYNLSEEGKKQEKVRLLNAALVTGENAKTEGLAAIDAKIAEIDAQEKKEAQKRANDTEYVQRLIEKLNLLGRVKIDSLSDDTLKEYFTEFVNDPMAISAIEQVIPPMRSAHIVPENNTGKRQEHLYQVRNSFESTINKVYEANSPRNLSKTEIDAFCDYIRKQNDDFSKNDQEVWEELQAENNGDPVGSFNFNFKGVR